jgi:lantibiotic modifying enzyme
MAIDNPLTRIREITDRENTDIDISLFHGDSGILMLQAVLYVMSPDESLKNIINKNLNNILDIIEGSTTDVSPTYSDGLAGIGCVIHFLHEHQIIDIDPVSFYEDIDFYLNVALESMLRDKNFDPLHGAIGIAMYFMLRKKYEPVKKIVQALYAAAERDNGEIKWSFIYEDSGQKVVDMGLSHGIAGIIFFLTKCYQCDMLPEMAQELINGAMIYCDHHLQDVAAIGSYYRDFIIYDDVYTPIFSRVGWCYGDAGILYSLYHAAKAIGNSELQLKFEGMLEHTASRRGYDATFINDAGFCHGSTGASIIFRALYAQTGNECFRKAFEYWKDYTITAVMKDLVADQPFELLSRSYEINDIHKKGLFTGIAGIGILLASCSQPLLPDTWTYYFLL